MDLKENSRGRFFTQFDRFLVSIRTLYPSKLPKTTIGSYVSLFQVSESVSNHHQRWTKVNQMELLFRQNFFLLIGKYSWTVVRSSSEAYFGCRSQIAIPAQGLIEFRDALTGLAVA